MNEMRFPRWVAAIGVFGGVAIALCFPLIVLMLGEGFSDVAKIWLSILGLLVGALLAGASAVIGITIPSAVSRGISLSGTGIRLGSTADCCPPEQPPSDGSTDRIVDDPV